MEKLTIDFPTMANIHDQHHEHPVLNLVEDAVIPKAQPEKIGTARQFHTSRRAGFSPSESMASRKRR